MISIIIPVYNTAKYLDACLNSVAAQSYTNWECILVDDGSTDGSSFICDEWAEKNQHFKVIHQQNQGVSAARNRGLSEANGDFVVFIDSDDWVEDSYLETLRKCVLSDTIDLGICGFKVEENGMTKEMSSDEGACDIDSSGSALFLQIETNVLLYSPWNKIYKRSILSDNKILFDRGVNFGEDLLFNLEYLNHSKRLYVSCNTPYHYVVFAGTSLSTCNRDDYFIINYDQWHSLLRFHIDKGLFNHSFSGLLYNRLWDIIYNSVFHIRNLDLSGVKDRYSYLKQILTIPEIGEPGFQSATFPTPKWMKTLIVRRRTLLLSLLFYFKWI